jgi:hypothetical protein
MKLSKIIKLLCGVLVLGSTLTAKTVEAGPIPGYPDVVQGYDAREVAMLPSYCKYTQSFRDNVPGGNNPAEIKRWYSMLGRGFHALHHYCWGLMKTNRALLLTKRKDMRGFYLASAINEYNYVIKSVTPGFALLPEILMKKAENLIHLRRGPEAVKELERAIELKADYWPPYVALSDYYKAAGDVGKARECLERGLSTAPDTKALKVRLAELDKTKGKPSSTISKQDEQSR